MDKLNFWKEQIQSVERATSKAKTLADMIGVAAVKLFPERSQLTVVENIQNMAEMLYAELGYVHGTVGLLEREVDDLKCFVDEAEKE